MFVLEAAERLEKLVIGGEIVKDSEYNEKMKENQKAFANLQGEIEKIQDEELKKNIKELLCIYIDTEGDRNAFEVDYTFRKAILLGNGLAAVESCIKNIEK